jgi:uroporphyrinogen decarboxylase
VGLVLIEVWLVTGKNRFITALLGGVPDRVPIFDFIDSPKFIQRVTGRRPKDYLAQDIMEVTLKYGFDAGFIGYGGFGGYDSMQESALHDEHYKDEWGTVYKKTGYSWPIDAPVDFPIKDWNDLKKYKPPDPDLPERMAEIKLAQKLAGDEAAVVGGVQGPLTTAILLCGLTNVFSKIIDDPRFVTEVFKLSNEYFGFAVRNMVEARVDVICVPEDLGFVSGPFFSTAHFRKLLLPYLIELFDRALQHGVPTFLHCDGNIDAYLDDLVAIGFNGLHPIQRTAGMSIEKVRKRFGTKLCLIGNIDSSYTLVFGNENDIILQTLQSILEGGLQGALIVASDSDIRDEMPYEKVDTMFKTALEYGVYPINVDAISEKLEQIRSETKRMK